MTLCFFAHGQFFGRQKAAATNIVFMKKGANVSN